MKFTAPLLSALVFTGAFAASIGHIAARTEMRATEEVCGLIRDNYFRPEQADVQAFLKRCETDYVPFNFSRTRAIQNINVKLAQIHSSHLALYSPDENRWLWENEGSDTGIRARMIDGEIVIIGTLEGSPARRAQLRTGDVIVAVNGEQPTAVQDVQATPGFYKIMRGEKSFLTDLKLENVHEDLSVQLDDIGAEKADLRIPSFLPSYFEKEAWLAVAKQLPNYKHVVVDLRGNAGGSFPAMLRALSPFLCKSQTVGTLYRSPRAGSAAPQDMADDLSADAQLVQVTASDEVRLKTFGTDYGCYAGSVTVLIDSVTSSVSEIFAKAMESRPRTRVWGWSSAGQVVMARWFSIGSLGGGDFAMSIPIAGFKTPRGDEIESNGVKPSRELYYDLKAALHGEDSWLNEALVSF